MDPKIEQHSSEEYTRHSALSADATERESEAGEVCEAAWDMAVVRILAGLLRNEVMEAETSWSQDVSLHQLSRHKHL